MTFGLIGIHQCRRKPEWSAAELQHFWPSIFWRFFKGHPSKQRPSFSRHCPLYKFICMGPLRSPFYSDPSFTQTDIRPFATNKALSGPFIPW